MLIINVYDRKANACSPWTSCYFNNDQLTEILLYDKEDLDNINNTSILDATINYFTERFDAELF